MSLDQDNSYREANSKRFILNREEYSIERRKAVQYGFYELQKKYPECVGVTFFGSTVKGYDNKQSDIDLCLYFDSSKIIKSLKFSGHFPPNIHNYREYINNIKSDFKYFILVELPRGCVNDIHLFTFEINFIQKDIDKCKQLLTQHNLSPIDLLEKDINVLEDKLGIRNFQFINHKREKFSYLFGLSVGDLSQSRAYLISKLKKEGKWGEDFWKLIIYHLQQRDTEIKREIAGQKKPHGLYDITLAEAEKIFCKKHQKNI